MHIQTTTINNGKYQGSINNAKQVAKEIARRWGEDEVKNYDPLTNCFTYKTWQEKGYQVKKGEKAIKIQTFIQNAVEDTQTKESVVVSSYPKNVNLFYILQVEEIKKP